MADNNGGPWGSGGSGGNKGNNNGNGGNDRKPDGPQIPEIDELMRKGQEQLRVLMGGKGNGGGGISPKAFHPTKSPRFARDHFVHLGVYNKGQ